MKEQTGGCVVLTSSAAAVMPAPFAALYNSTKAFLSAFGSSLAAEVRTSSTTYQQLHFLNVVGLFPSVKGRLTLSRLQVATSKIDVMVFHPSPVASRFATSADHKIDILEFFNLFAVPPSRLPDAMFAAVGRCIWRDFGMIALMFRMLSKLVDFNFLAWASAATIHMTPDFKRYAKM
jgi:short-subunit dehydrogenase